MAQPDEFWDDAHGDEDNARGGRQRAARGHRRGIHAGRGLRGEDDGNDGPRAGRQQAGGRGRGRGRGGGLQDFGPRQLRELANRDPGQLVLTLAHPGSGFKNAIQQSIQNPDLIPLLLRVLATAALSKALPGYMAEIFALVKDGNFFDSAINYLIELQQDIPVMKEREFKQALKDFINLLREMSLQMPHSITQFLGPYAALETVINTQRQSSSLIDGDILIAFTDLTRQKEDLYTRLQRRNAPTGRSDQARFEEQPPPEDFRDIEIFPQNADFQVEDGPYLRQNRVKGEYENLDQYLDIQFRLMREDFVGPLRDGIASYIEAFEERGRTNKKIQEVRIYPNVRIIAPVCSDSGLCHVLQFDVSRMGKVRWASSKKLIYGSLVCLSSDNFRTFYFATVAQREIKDLEKGLIQVQFELNQGAVRDLMEATYIMAETTAYFESYRHILSGLKTIREGDLPFERHIIKCNNDVNPPAYIMRHPDTTFDLRPLVDTDVVLLADSHLDEAGEVVEVDQVYNFSQASEEAKTVQVLDRSTWPPQDLLHLDALQYKALNTALTREFSIIQGPPGTGKTYIGLKIVKALLHNRKCWSVDPNTGEESLKPMLIVCYTNHALDQFLEGIVEFFKGDIIRVGGRSSSEVLKDYNLRQFRQRFRNAQKISAAVFQGRREAKQEMDNLRTHIDESAARIQMAQTNILHEDFLEHVMAHWYQLLTRQFNEMVNNYDGARHLLGRRFSVIVEWLGLGNLADVVEVESTVPAEIVPGEIEEEMIEAEDELDVLQAQRRLEAGDDDDDDEVEHEIDELLDQLLDQGKTRREKENARLQINMARAHKQAVALSLNDFDRRHRDQDTGRWEQQRGQKKKLKTRFQRELASGDIMTEQEAGRVRELWKMSIKDKWRMYRMWVQRYRQLLIEKIEEKETEFEQAAQRYREALMQEDKEILRRATIIGMTTTGAARYQAILQEIQPRIVVVEEAAEVLEAHIITTLNSACEHLILIGDHKQLKPNPTVYQLATKYNLEVSLFERMINNGIKWDCLGLQHRMRPEIAELMIPIYKDLQNHEDVYQYEDVRGVARNVFFIDHRAPEQNDLDLTSHSNVFEAEYISALCNYFLLQGYKPSQITVLTLYSGQLFCLKNKMPKDRYDGVRLTVVDNYQGEENDIILLSLVRSNPDGVAGFVKKDNRVCVALSRAKIGFYAIGNFELLANSSNLWNEITIQMSRKKQLGDALQLSCQNHPEDGGIEVRLPDDFTKAPEGGCGKKCDTRLKCGHTCRMFCHVLDRDHKEYKCRKPCPKVICSNNHRCQGRCFEECGECQVLTLKKLRRCGHEQEVPCHIDPDQFICKQDCTKKLACGHRCQASCGEAHTSVCGETIDHVWSCGHKGKARCGEKKTSFCPQHCRQQLECGHSCQGACGSCFRGRLHKVCPNPCRRILVCGHECQDKCDYCPPCQRPCQNRCKHNRCRDRCGEECARCMEPCSWTCVHYECGMLCSEPCDRPRCNEPCREMLDCGHQCIGLCGEPCPPLCRQCDRDEVTQIMFGNEDEPDARFVLLEDCQHIIEYEAMDTCMDDATLGDGAIQLKVCPSCKTPIRKSTRYGTIVNKALQDIEKVKRIVIGNEAKVLQLQAEIKRSITNLPVSDRKDMNDRYTSFQNPPTEVGLVTLDNQITFLTYLNDLEIEYEKLRSVIFVAEKNKGLDNLTKVRDWVKKERKRMTVQETNDAKMEISRIEYQLKLLLHEQVIQEKRMQVGTDVRRELQEMQRLCSEGEKYTEDRHKAITAFLKRLKDIAPLSGLGVSEADKIMIVEALQLKQGHWYKCPNGHPYAIGDCGAANQASTCPECGLGIGGQGAQLADGNVTADNLFL